VTIEAVTTTANLYGEPTESWTVVAVVWGELVPLMAGAREAFAQQGAQMQAKVAYQCRMRGRELSPATNRLVVAGRRFEVTGVMDPDGRGVETVALCFEVQ
jgi:head-tail adaptor